MNTYSKTTKMPRKAWTDDEVRALCVLYQLMLTAQRDGVKFVKAKPVREIAASMGRSKGSVEAKLMNISGCRHAIGRDYVNGYKPLSGFAKSMPAIVAECVR